MGSDITYTCIYIINQATRDSRASPTPNRQISVQLLQYSHRGQVRIQRGGGEDRDSGPPGKSQVIWVSIGNKQLDCPGPPHPP